MPTDTSGVATGYPRPLTDRERATLEFVLSVDDPRAEPLRAQAHTALVESVCACGCATITLRVDRSTGMPSTFRSPAINAFKQGMLDGPLDAEPYELLLFLDDGWLGSLELVWYGDKPIPDFPELSTFEAPEIDALTQRDERVEAAQAFFADRGQQLLMGRGNREFHAHLGKLNGRLVSPHYARGDSPGEVADRARQRAETEPPSPARRFLRWVHQKLT
jgi:hypothetical protein